MGQLRPRGKDGMFGPWGEITRDKGRLPPVQKTVLFMRDYKATNPASIFFGKKIRDDSFDVVCKIEQSVALNIPFVKALHLCAGCMPCE